MMRLTGIAVLVGSAAIMAAPVPKQEPLEARIQKFFGEFQDPDHCAECSMNADNQLKLTLRDGASQLWADEDDKQKGIAKSPLTRMIAKGDFDATVNVRMKGFPKPDKNDFYLFNVGMYISSDPKH